MKIISTIRRRLEELLTAPGEQLGRGAKFVRFQVQLWRFCARRLREHNALAMSAALSFRTIFAMVPTLVLALLVVKSMGILGDRRAAVQDALAALKLDRITLEQTPPPGEGAGAVGATTRPRRRDLADVLTGLVGRAESKLTFGRIGPVGALLLIWSALALLTTIERSLNRIFGAGRSRSLGRRVLLYWSVVTLGPVLLVTARYLGGQLISASQRVPGLPWLLAGLGWAGPVVVGIVLLAALYKLMPNTRVPFRAAIGGAVVAVPLWLVAMWGFGLYVGQVAGGSLYGTLGLLPLFLIWLNVSWLIFLFGAELAHTAVNLEQMEMAALAARSIAGPLDLLAAALAVAGPYVRGEGPVPAGRVASGARLPAETLQLLLDRLTEAGIVSPAQESDQEAAYVLSRPAERIRVAAVLDAGGVTPAEGDAGRAAGADPTIASALEHVRRRTDGALEGLTLADVLAEAAGPK